MSKVLTFPHDMVFDFIESLEMEIDFNYHPRRASLESRRLVPACCLG